MNSRGRGTPVIMYHGVGKDYPGWDWNHLLTPLDVFEGHMRALKEEGWTTISLERLHAHMAAGTELPEKSIVLTFDDGYRDNWVHAFPILRKYGHRAVIWVASDFVDPRADVSPTLDDVWAGRLSPDALDARGYLSWAEMRRMVASGVIEIQSHAKTHTWHFSGPRIVDFHRPEEVEGYRTPLWLIWNRFPEDKHRTMHERMGARIPFGTPIYECEKALVARRYFDDPSLASRLVSFVAENGGPSFFARTGWRGMLESVERDFGPRRDGFESDEERRSRIDEELAGSKRALEATLGTRVDFLCWPGGAHSESLRAAAADAGYTATTLSFENPSKKNVHGEDPTEINRIGSGSPWLWRGKIIKRTDARFFIAGLALARGERNSIWKYRLHKLKYVLRLYCTGVR